MFSKYPYYGRLINQWAGNWTTGVLPAALAADAAVASIRNGPTQTLSGTQPTTKIFVTGLRIQVSSTVAFTAIQQFGFYLQRFSSNPHTGGASQNPFRIEGGTNGSAQSVAQPGGGAAGDLRVATTAALGGGGVVENVKVPIYSWTAVGPADYPFSFIDFRQNPILLDVGEGLALYNQIVWPVAGTAILSATIFWDEAFI